MSIRMRLAPIPTTMTRVIAQRDLVLDVHGKRRRVRVRIGGPIREVDTARGRDWRCPIRVSGVGKNRKDRGLGVDSLQALVHALKLVEQEITELEKRTSGRFLWFGDLWHGLPKVRLAVPPFVKRPNRRVQPAAGIRGSRGNR